ncbi:MAG: hypothetical protein WCX61_03205 [Candidatus Peribacteraceae bacterium]|jgi:hypothetical protein
MEDPEDILEDEPEATLCFQFALAHDVVARMKEEEPEADCVEDTLANDLENALLDQDIPVNVSVQRTDDGLDDGTLEPVRDVSFIAAVSIPADLVEETRQLVQEVLGPCGEIPLGHPDFIHPLEEDVGNTCEYNEGADEDTFGLFDGLPWKGSDKNSYS